MGILVVGKRQRVPVFLVQEFLAVEQLLLELIDQPKSVWLVGEMVYTEEPWQLPARRRCTVAEFAQWCLDPFWQTQSLFTDPICGVFPGDCIELAEGIYELGFDYRLVQARSLAITGV